MIKGLPGSKVKLHVRREGYDEYLEFDVERAPIKIKSVVYSPIKGTDKGYLKIKSFGSDTTGDVQKALKFFNDKKINKLIIDLRYNPGGLLSAAISISILTTRMCLESYCISPEYISFMKGYIDNSIP